MLCLKLMSVWGKKWNKIRSIGNVEEGTGLGISRRWDREGLTK